MALFSKKTTNYPRRRQTSGTDNRDSGQSPSNQYIFQRNRTLTGSTSSQLSDPGRQSDLKSPRTHAHHLALRRRKIGAIFLIVLGACLFLFMLLMQFTASVTVDVSNANISKKIDDARYIKAINDYLGLHPFSRLRFALNKTDLKDYLVSVVPEVADVTNVSLGTIGQTNVTLSMRQPVAGWTINLNQYFVDANGVAYQQNYFAAPAVEIVDQSGVALEQGTTVASNNFLGFVGRVVALSASRKYQVTQAIIPSGTTRELEIVLQGVTPHVRLSIDRPAGEQVEDMDNALKYLAAHGQAPSYIDVRVSGKAFYK